MRTSLPLPIAIPVVLICCLFAGTGAAQEAAARAAVAGEQASDEQEAVDTREGSDAERSSPGAAVATIPRGVPVEAASQVQKASAKERFVVGLELLEAEKLAEALEAFTMSFSEVASPNSQLMIARTLIKLARYDEAYDQLAQAKATATELARSIPRYAKTVEAADSELAELKKHVALLTISTASEVSVNGESLPGDRLGRPITLLPGKHEIEYSLKNGQRASESVELVAGEDRAVQLAIPSPPSLTAEPSPRVVPPADERSENAISRKTLGYVGLGVGGAGLIGFSVFALVNKSIHDDLERDCLGNLCPEAVADDVAAGRTYQTLANVSLGVGVVGLATSAYFLLIAGDDDERSAARDQGLQLGIGDIRWKGSF